MTANERSDLGINRSQAGQPPLPGNSPPGLIVAPHRQVLPMQVKAKVNVAPRVLVQGFRRLSYVLMYPVMFRHRRREYQSSYLSMKSSSRTRRIVGIACTAPSSSDKIACTARISHQQSGTCLFAHLPARRCGWHAGHGKTLFWPIDIARLRFRLVAIIAMIGPRKLLFLGCDRSYVW